VGEIACFFGVEILFLGRILWNLGRIGRKPILKIHLFFTFCDDFLLFCGKSKKITVFDGKLRGEKRGFVGFWGLNGDFWFFWVKSAEIFGFGVGILEFWCRVWGIRFVGE